MSERVKELSTASFAQEIADGAVLVEFGTAWCAPCRAMLPVLDQLAVELQGQVRFARVDAEEEPALAQRFSIRALPTMILFRDGLPVDELHGSMAKAKLHARLLDRLARRAA